MKTIYDAISKTTTARNYNTLGNITEETLATGLTFFNDYDHQGRRKKLTLPDNSEIDYAYDGAFLGHVTRHENACTYKVRDLDGCPLEIDLPAGTITITRDSLSRIETFSFPAYSAQFPKNAFDPVGNLLHYHCEDPLGKMTYTYVYDDLNQLILEQDHTYRFDSLHNRLEKDHASHTVNDLCQIEHDGDVSYKYDLDGNLIFDGTWSYTYDTQDRLIALESKNKRIEYVYDPFHRRLSKTVNGMVQECYLWDGDNEIGVIDEKGIITQLRILGEGLGAEIGSAVLYELNQKTYVPIHDHRGNLAILIDVETQKPIEIYRYTAFGEELIPAKISPWRFSSKRVEEEMGLIFFGRRYYLPTLGRWITQDPQGFEDGPNLYAYLHNCPLNDFDPYGLWSWMSMYEAPKSFGWEGTKYFIKKGFVDTYHGLTNMGEWMHADFQYEYFNDRSFFQAKSYQAAEGWKNFRKDPLGNVIPGFMEALRNPTNAGAWGKATVDVAMAALAIGQIGKASQVLGKVGRVAGKEAVLERISATHRVATTSRGSESVNAGINLTKKLSQLEAAQQCAVNTRFLSNDRIRYYGSEKLAFTIGPTRGRAYVTEFDLRSGKVRTWMECYGHNGAVNRVHPKQINGQDLSSPHYPPTARELGLYE